MKRVAAFIFAFLAVCYFQAADAQFNRFSGCDREGFCPGTGGGPTVTPVSNACINSSGTTITFTAQGIGNANVNRITVVTIAWDDSTAAGTSELTAMTVGGISMARAVRAAGDNQNSNSEIWYVANPTGTTANIVATFSTAVDGITIEVYSLIGYNTLVSSTTGTTSVSSPYINKQLGIAVGSRRVNVSTSLSNMTNDFSSACGANLWGVHASQPLHGNNGTLSSTISPTSNTPLIALAIWSVPCANVGHAAAFLARTSGLDGTHVTAYTNYLNSLDGHGLTCLFDVLEVFSTQDSTTAGLNLVSTNFSPAIIHGSPTFTADRGYQGVELSNTVYIDMGAFQANVGSPNYTQNCGALSVWSVNNDTSGAAAIGSITLGTSESTIWPRHSSGSSFYRIQGAGVTGFVNANGAGHYMGNRTSSGAGVDGYKNGSSVGNTSGASQAVSNFGFYTIGYANGATPVGAGYQVAMASISACMTPAQITNFYNDTRTFMTAVGVP